MEMRGRPLGARYYQPWDPLQLSEEVSGPHLVFKNKIIFSLYRTYRHKVKYSPLISKNLAVFSPSPEEPLTLLTHLCEQAVKGAFHEGFTLEVYSFPSTSQEVVESIAPLDEKYYFLRQHPYEEGLPHFLQEVERHALLLRGKARAQGFLEPPEKRVTFLVLLLGAREVEALSTPPVAKAFRDLLTAYEHERLVPMVLASSAQALPRHLLGYFEVAAYLGEANETYAEEKLYTHLRPALGSFSQEAIGYLYHHAFTRSLLRCHPLIFTPSPWRVERDAAYAHEERLYREYLASLRKDTP